VTHRYSRRAHVIAAVLCAGIVSAFGGDSASASLAVDTTVSAHQGGASKSISSPAFSTAAPNELLLAFIASDGPSAGGSQSFSSVTGGGLSWRLRRRANTQAGTAEIWQAVAPLTLSNASVTATRATGSYGGSITVVAFSGADVLLDGSTTAAGASSGVPSVSLASSKAGSWVWGVGNDWDRATTRALGANQTMVDEFLAPTGDTLWVQRQTSTTPFAGTQVTLNDTAPNADRWNHGLSATTGTRRGNVLSAPVRRWATSSSARAATPSGRRG
jgi:hypothetical protein